MNKEDILEKIIAPLLAAFIGAIAAFRYQNKAELKRDKRNILQVLMAYRTVWAYENDWIKAMNAIDIVFSDNEKVRELYHTFTAQTRPPADQNQQYVETYYRLIYEMAQCSGYRNLKMHDIRDYYHPIGLRQHYPAMYTENVPSPPSSIPPPSST